jgi:(5-formylfuran-3-yl)methyl phosphate transaminase
MGIVDEALRLERLGRPVIHLEKGELEMPTPAVIKDRVIQAVRENQTHYSTSNGLIELRQAICEHYARVYQVAVEPSRVIINSGSSPAMLELFLGILQPGDEVLIPNPGYPAYPHLVTAARGRPVWVGTERSGFAYSAELARPYLSAKTKAVLLNFPSNPAGALADASTLQGFAELGPLVVSDEVYHGLAFDGIRPRTILEHTDNAVVVGSFSKAFAMTGWRLGYLIVPPALVDTMVRLQQYLFVSPNTFVQWAAITALANAEVIARQLRDELRERHAAILGPLQELGFEVPCVPRGGFYLFARLPPGSGSAAQFASGLLRQRYVAVTPGGEFGSDGEGYVRCSMSAPAGQIHEAIERIAAFLDERGIAPEAQTTDALRQNR